MLWKVPTAMVFQCRIIIERLFILSLFEWFTSSRLHCFILSWNSHFNSHLIELITTFSLLLPLPIYSCMPDSYLLTSVIVNMVTHQDIPHQHWKHPSRSWSSNDSSPKVPTIFNNTFSKALKRPILSAFSMNSSWIISIFSLLNTLFYHVSSWLLSNLKVNTLRSP